LKSKSFQALFSQGRPVIGTFLHIPASEIVEIVGLCGYDAIVIDTEHTSFGIETAERLILAARAADICPIVRVSTKSPDWVRKALDAGAAGIIFPNIASEEDARLAVSLSKYAPVGERGACPNVRAADFGKRGLSYYAEANSETAVILLIEHIKGYEEFDKILDVPGIDAIYLGPYDLSVSMELAGQVNHPDVLRVLDDMMVRAHKKGLLCGNYCLDIEKTKEWLRKGMDFMLYNTDVSVLMQKYGADLEELRKK